MPVNVFSIHQLNMHENKQIRCEHKQIICNLNYFRHSRIISSKDFRRHDEKDEDSEMDEQPGQVDDAKYFIRRYFVEQRQAEKAEKKHFPLRIIRYCHWES